MITPTVIESDLAYFVWTVITVGCQRLHGRDWLASRVAHVHIVNDFAEPRPTASPEHRDRRRVCSGRGSEPPVMHGHRSVPMAYHRLSVSTNEVEQDGWSKPSRAKYLPERRVRTGSRSNSRRDALSSWSSPKSSKQATGTPARDVLETSRSSAASSATGRSDQTEVTEPGKTEYPSTQTVRRGSTSVRTTTRVHSRTRVFSTPVIFRAYNYYINYRTRYNVVMPVSTSRPLVTEFYEYRERENDSPAQYFWKAG